MGCVWGMPSLSPLSSLGDRYDLRMPIYGCADKLPSQSPSLKSVEKKKTTTTTTEESNNNNNYDDGDVLL